MITITADFPILVFPLLPFFYSSHISLLIFPFSSWLLILTWIFGDAFKLSYFILKQSPTPFIVCGSIQFCTDSLIAIVMSCDSSRRSVESVI